MIETVSGPQRRWFSRESAVRWLPLAAALILGAGLRFHRIGALPLWHDEAASYCIARLPLADIWGVIGRHEWSPPLYYALQHLWLVFGDSEVAIRSLSAVFGVLAILVIYGLGRTLGGHTSGVIAAVLLATSPIHIRYSQEARTYMTLFTCTTLALWGLAHLLKHPEQACIPLFLKRRRTPEASTPEEQPSDPSFRARLAWLAYGGGTVLALYCHSTAALLPALTTFVAVVVWTASRKITRGFAWNWVVVNTVILLLWSWWLWTALQQITTGMEEFWIRSPTLGSSWEHMTSLYGQKYAPVVLRPWADLGILCLALFGLWRLRKKPRLLLLVLSVLLGIPLLTLAISYWRSVWIERVLLWPTAAWLALIAVAVGALSRRRFVFAVIALLVLVHLGGVVAYHRRAHKPPWDKAMAVVSENFKPGDAILFCPNSAEWLFSYYLRHANFDPGCARYGVVLGKSTQQMAVFFEAESIRLADLPAIPENHQRLWFVVWKYSDTRKHALPVLKKMWREQGRILQSWEDPRITIVLFSKTKTDG